MGRGQAPGPPPFGVSRARFLGAACLDIRVAFKWYDAQRPGLGDEFIAAVDAGINVVLAFPDAHPAVHRDTRRFLIERFPYGLFYRVSDTGVVVVACLHAARDPEEQTARLDERAGDPGS